jgi:hypothetical protein
MTAITTNPVDWLLAALLGIPCLVAAVAYVGWWVQDRTGCPCEMCREDRARR